MVQNPKTIIIKVIKYKMKMKKILLICLLTSLVSCKNEAERKYEESIEALATDSSFIVNTKTPKELSITKKNEKLISAFKDMPQTIDADVYKSTLTVRVTLIDKEEAQKLAEGIFSQTKKYPENNHIKTVMVVDANYILLGYAGKK